MRILMRWVIVSLFAIGSAHAANVHFLGNAPIAYMNDADIRLFREAAAQALDDTADGKTVTWRNPETQAFGEIKLLRTEVRDELFCRVAQVHNRAAGRENVGVYRACKDAGGDWRLAAAGESASNVRAGSHD
jgi:surface antigen